jgi:cytoskeletal protein CcmA (bactofilin family)
MKITFRVHFPLRDNFFHSTICLILLAGLSSKMCVARESAAHRLTQQNSLPCVKATSSTTQSVKKRNFIMSAMWKPTQNAVATPAATPEPIRPTTNSTNPAFEPASRPSAASEQASIGKGLSFKGEITGNESLFIDGKVEGSINLPGNRVTVGRNGLVTASVVAREIVVLGKIKGNVSATDRVDIRAEGSLTGDVAAARISIEDGAFFKGGIDIKKADTTSKSNSTAPMVVVGEPEQVAQV